MTFDEVEKILGFSLPHPARRRNKWWENQKGKRSKRTQCKAWLDSGFHTENVSIPKKTVDFGLGLPMAEGPQTCEIAWGG